MSDISKKKERIALIRRDIQKNIEASGAFGDEPIFTEEQTAIIDVFFNYLIDCIAELELKVEKLEAGGAQARVDAISSARVDVPDLSGRTGTPVLIR